MRYPFFENNDAQRKNTSQKDKEQPKEQVFSTSGKILFSNTIPAKLTFQNKKSKNLTARKIFPQFLTFSAGHCFKWPLEIFKNFNTSELKVTRRTILSYGKFQNAATIAVQKKSKSSMHYITATYLTGYDSKSSETQITYSTTKSNKSK